MFLYTSVQMAIHVHTNVHTCVYTHASAHAYTHVCTHVHINVHTHVHTSSRSCQYRKSFSARLAFMCGRQPNTIRDVLPTSDCCFSAHLYAYIHMHIHTSMHLSICMSMHTSMHTSIYTCTDVYVPVIHMLRRILLCWHVPVSIDLMGLRTVCACGCSAADRKTPWLCRYAYRHGCRHACTHVHAGVHTRLCKDITTQGSSMPRFVT